MKNLKSLRRLHARVGEGKEAVLSGSLPSVAVCIDMKDAYNEKDCEMQKSTRPGCELKRLKDKVGAV